MCSRRRVDLCRQFNYLLTYLHIYWLALFLVCPVGAAYVLSVGCLFDFIFFLFTYLLQFYCREYEAVKHDGT